MAGKRRLTHLDKAGAASMVDVSAKAVTERIAIAEGAGVMAAHTILPVIGVPMESGLMGLDSLLSTVRMPAGVPVATVAIGKAGAKNAGYLAAQIMALSDPALAACLRDEREANAKQVQAKDAELQTKLKKS